MKHLDVGKKGEDLCEIFLMKNGFSIIERNYRKKFGEIDIVAKKADIIHFVEVKTVSRETNVIHETPENNDPDFEPEDNVHSKKRRRMKRIVEIYLEDRKVPQETWFQIDVASVLLDPRTGEAKIDFLEDVVI